MKFFGPWINAKNMRKTRKISRKIADSENFFVDALCCGRSPRGCIALRTPISKCGRIALRTRIICPPLVPTPKSATGDHLAPKHKQTLHKGSLAPCKDSNATCCTTTMSLALKTWAAQSHMSTSPHTAHLVCTVFTPFLPPYYPNGATFTPFLP